jgi:hypothetical protein
MFLVVINVGVARLFQPIPFAETRWVSLPPGVVAAARLHPRGALLQRETASGAPSNLPRAPLAVVAPLFVLALAAGGRAPKGKAAAVKKVDPTDAFDEDIFGDNDEDPEEPVDTLVRESTPDTLMYPEGTPEVSKGDRRGQMWSTWGEPDLTTGVRPDFQRLDDWHISSSYGPEEKAIVDAEEDEWDRELDEKDAESPWWGEEEEEEDVRAEILKKFENTGDVKISKFKMPQSELEFNRLRDRVEACVEDETLRPEQRNEAARIAQELFEFFPQFCDIIDEEWTLENNEGVNGAIQFLRKLKREIVEVEVEEEKYILNQIGADTDRNYGYELTPESEYEGRIATREFSDIDHGGMHAGD